MATLQCESCKGREFHQHEDSENGLLELKCSTCGAIMDTRFIAAIDMNEPIFLNPSPSDSGRHTIEIQVIDPDECVHTLEFLYDIKAKAISPDAISVPVETAQELENLREWMEEFGWDDRQIEEYVESIDPPDYTQPGSRPPYWH